jgi:hypothetical protein
VPRRLYVNGRLQELLGLCKVLLMTLCVGYPGHARLLTIRMSLSQPGDGAGAAFPSLQELPDPIICHMTSYLLHPELAQLSMLSRWVSKRREASPDAVKALQLLRVPNSHSTNFSPCNSGEALCEYVKAHGKQLLSNSSSGIKVEVCEGGVAMCPVFGSTKTPNLISRQLYLGQADAAMLSTT